jgi:hypothetical protein
MLMGLLFLGQCFIFYSFYKNLKVPGSPTPPFLHRVDKQNITLELFKNGN